MKKLLFSVALLATSLSSFSQVGIGTKSPDASAVLDLTSKTRGLLLPRLDSTKVVANPVNGLMIYDKLSKCVKVYQNDEWSDCISAGSGSVGLAGGVWMDRNLGATQAATSSTDAAAYGDLYQWGRSKDGHESRTSAVTNTTVTTASPGHGDFIIGSSNWTSFESASGATMTLWQEGTTGVNNPCPSGYRVPTEAELVAEKDKFTKQNAEGAFASPLKLPLTGFRYYKSNGAIYKVGRRGYYWSSTVSGTNARGLNFDSISAKMDSNNRSHGFSVRCIKVVEPAAPAVSTINASGKIDAITFDGRKYEKDIQPNSFKVSYTGGNGRPYAESTVESTGVTGLTLTLAAGTLTNGTGNLEYKLSGTASANTGVASFVISFGGKTETKTFTLNQPSPSRNPISHGDCGGMISATKFKRFACHNLGANTSLDPNIPGVGLNGAYYQWGKRKAVAEAPTATDPKSGAVSGWSGDPASNGSWNSGTETAPKKNTTNDPCPTGFRIPTKTEWVLINSNNTVTRTGTFTDNSNDNTNYEPMLHFGKGPHNLLSLPVAGFRDYLTSGPLDGRAHNGNYWSSTESDRNHAYRLAFSSSVVYPAYNYTRTYGISVRCIAAE